MNFNTSSPYELWIDKPTIHHTDARIVSTATFATVFTTRRQSTSRVTSHA